MDHHHPWGPAVKGEYEQIGISSGGGDASSSSSSSSLYFGNVGVPQAIEGLHDAGPPPFVTKTFDMVDDPSTARTVSWSRGGHSFVVWDPHAFSTTLLPKYFKHSNFSSFVRQLNTYGFRKIDPDRWEFANEGFLMGHKHLLKYIKRRKVPAQPMASQQAVVPCVVELGEYGGGTTDATEVDRLRRDKEILMSEMAKLRQHQQKTRTYLQTMEERIQRTQQKQRYTMAFIARAVQNPAFIHQLLQQKDKRKELEEGSSNGKRRLSMSQGFTSQGQGLNLSLIRADSGILQDDGYEVSELEALALEIQGYHKSGKAPRQDEEIKFRESMEKELDEEFWEELLSTGWLDIHDTKEDVRKDEDVSLLADKLGYLGSIPNLKAIHGPKPVQVQTRIPRVTSDDC